MYRNKWIAILSILATVAMVLSSCAVPTPQVITQVQTVVVERQVPIEKQVVSTVIVEKEKIIEKSVVQTVVVEREKVVKETVLVKPTAPSFFAGAYPYQVPPVGHMNIFVTNAINIGIYQDFMEMPFARYYWATDKWEPYLATSWELKPPDTFIVKLRKDVKWSDDKPFTAKDVICTYNILRLQNNTVWRYLSKVEAVDDYTVNFVMGKPTTIIVRYVLSQRIAPCVTYGEWSSKVQALVDAKKTKDDAEWKDLLTKFIEFRPTTRIITGPYNINMQTLNEARLTMDKNPKSFWADKVKFDYILMYNGETPVVTPLVLANQVDYATHGFPPATEKAFIAGGIRVLRPPIYSGPALRFNYDLYPLNRPEVHKALAYAINRAENATVSLGQSAKGVVNMAGFSDNIVSIWISPADLAKFDKYEYNPAKGEELLKSIGFKKGSDGVWVDDKGKKMEWELTVPAEYADWSAAAENAAQQLTKFGWKTTLRGVNFNDHPIMVDRGQFQMAIRGWGAAHPHPQFSFDADLFVHNLNLTEGKGMNFPMVQDTKCCGKIDLEKEIVASAEGLDEKAQKAGVTKVAQAFNELLPIVPLWERYGNNPVQDKLHTQGWPPDTDPIYKNSPYADSFVVMMILSGTLKPYP